MVPSSINVFVKYTSVTVIVVILCSELAACCFIRNCPPGGKRSMDLVSRAVVPCLSCGPENTGQCIGPNICCGPFGCYIGTQETRICLKENDRGQACEIRGEPCGARGQGYCVADNVCCDSKACSLNDKCRQSNGTDGAQLLSLLNRILEVGDLE